MRPTTLTNTPTHDGMGRPLGYHNGKHWVWTATNGRYSCKRRTFDTPTGEQVASLLPYTYGMFLKPTTGPRGGRAYKECYRQLWWHDGHVCKVGKQRDEQGQWHRTLEPYSGYCWNRYDATESRYVMNDGVPIATYEGNDTDNVTWIR